MNGAGDESSPARRDTRRLISIALIGIAIFVILLTIGVYHGLIAAGIIEQHFDKVHATAAVANINAGTLTALPNGIVVLPAALSSASCDGKAYVTIDSSGGKWILFPRLRGKGANLSGYVYHAAPSPIAPPTTLPLRGPVPPPPGASGPATATNNFTVDGQIDRNWFHVVWNLD